MGLELFAMREKEILDQIKQGSLEIKDVPNELMTESLCLECVIYDSSIFSKLPRDKQTSKVIIEMAK